MKLTESHLRNLIKQELKQFLKLNENDGLDSLDTEIPDEPDEPDEGEELSDEEIALNALEPDDTEFPLDSKNPMSLISAEEIGDDADELGLYVMNIPLHRAARAASRFARKYKI